MQRRFGVGIGVWFRKAVAEDGCTRGSLVRGLCEFVDWRNAIMLHKFCKQFSRGIGYGKSIGFGINYPLNRKGRHHDRDGYGRPMSLGASLDLRASEPRGGAGGLGRVAGEVAGVAAEALQLGRGDVRVSAAASAAPSSNALDEHA